MVSRERKAPEPAYGETKHDEIGFWSEIKLDILKAYWPEYTKIVKAQQWKFRTIYVDAFAGSGRHISRSTGEFVMGSPARALDVQPPFDEYHFIDMDEAKVKSLEHLTADRDDVIVHHGDCNQILLSEIFPLAEYKKFSRAVCLLDPYSLQLDWKVTAEAGAMKTIEIFLNFPIMDINRSVLRRNATPSKLQQMTRFWGDESWRNIAYREEPRLFEAPSQQKVENWELADAFRERLRSAGHFKVRTETTRDAELKSSGRVLPFLCWQQRDWRANRRLDLQRLSSERLRLSERTLPHEREV
jgi:three-Cys-motif partner protein